MAADTIENPNIAATKPSTPSYSSPKCGGPFTATKLYRDVVDHAKVNIAVKRRKLKGKQSEEHFSGNDFVTVIEQRLHQEWSSVTKTITREKVVKLCQLLLDDNVIVSVAAQNGSDTSVFCDSSSSHYAFTTQEHSISTPGVESVGRCSRRSSYSSYHPDFTDSLSTSKSSKYGIHEILDLSGKWTRQSAGNLRRKLTPVKVFGRKLSLLQSPLVIETPSKRSLAVSDIDDIWQEVALNKLLGILEVPILDDILSYDGEPLPKVDKQDMAFSNLAFRRQEFYSPAQLSSGQNRRDSLFEAAVDCLECHPRGLDVIDQSLNEYSSTTQKLCLYQSIVDYYAEQNDPLWSNHFTDIHVGLYSLLMQGKEGQVIEAFQASILLLANKVKEELKRLLAFMSLVAEDESLKLSSTHSNREQVESHFTSAILRNKVLAPHQAGQLVSFMVDHCHSIFCCPSDIEETVDARVKQLRQGFKETRIETTFCAQVTEEEFRKHQTETTEQAIVELTNSILDNTKFSLKEKKQKLKHLRKHHPQIYDRYFGEML